MTGASRGGLIPLRSPSIALALLIAATAPAAAGEERSIIQELPLQASQSVQLKVSVAQVLVEPTDEQIVRASMVVRCEKEPEACRKKLDRIELVMTSSSDRLLVTTEGLKRTSTGLQVSIRLEVPRDRALELDIGVGDVRVRGHEADLEIDIGVGDVELTLPQTAVRSLELDTGVGTARLSNALGEHTGSGFVGSHFSWSQGSGVATVEIDTGVGEIEVDLE